jgi:sugar phosphate isomerase/epimerase
LNTATIRAKKLPLLEAIEITAKAGYDAIEPWIDEIDLYESSGGNLDELRAIIEDFGLTVEGAIGFFEWLSDDEDRRRKGLDEARRNMEMLALIGGKHVAAPPFGSTEVTNLNLMTAAERYRALLEVGDEFGVAPLLEVWGFSKSISHLSEALYIAAQADHPKACILADVYHLYKGGSGFNGLQIVNPRALPIFHVNDYPAMPDRENISDSDRVYPGDGIAPLVDIFSTMHDAGFDGVLSLELFNESYYQNEAQTIADTGISKLRAVVEACHLGDL